ncbi:NAD(P)-dependent oxidoreductase, partial [Candidatus Marsarchaeota archaeon]|jgi:nucleoside-diphosphate-sugar epimerase|nr:NAD(P)-dependent oxidoreductase [Candidatus Marsarchaeota archaeon]MCL5099729.1 NAD(P)-dependent oxidoreductase [Candidatus Marsarchaeota archaeon]
MRIFVTGSNGYIGSEFIKHASINKELEIVGYDLKNGQDVLDYGGLKKAMKGSDVVVHLAAIRGPDPDKTFSEYFKVNCEGAFNVAHAALENKVKRLVYSSSTSYYGLERGIPFVKPIKEGNPIITQHVKPQDLNCRDCDIAYSTSKVIAEQILANFGLMKKLDVIILRFGPIGGRPGERWELDGISLKIENSAKALELAVRLNRKLWYEVFTITDAVPNVDLSKARSILGYNPV